MTPRFDKVSESTLSPCSPRRAIMPGSFNPFTRGHADILERALNMFDEVVVAVGFNIEKGNPEDIERRVEDIRRLYESESRVKVTSYSGLTASLAEKLGIGTLIRGVRDIKDFEYERTLADVNRRIAGLETILLTARPEYACFSSSTVRELEHFGFDVSEFLPSRGPDS